jgi:hypothetical protein
MGHTNKKCPNLQGCKQSSINNSYKYIFIKIIYQSYASVIISKSSVVLLSSASQFSLSIISTTL